MMNRQFLRKIRLVNIASLAPVSIPGPRPPRLSLPIRSIIRLITATPRRILRARHIAFMGLVEAFLCAVRDIASIHSVSLPAEPYSTNRTCECHLRKWCADNPIGSLPRPTAFSIAEVVLLLSAWWNAFLFAAPITRNSQGFVTAICTIVLLGAACPPIWSLHLNSAHTTGNRLHTWNITRKCHSLQIQAAR